MPNRVVAQKIVNNISRRAGFGIIRDAVPIPIGALLDLNGYSSGTCLAVDAGGVCIFTHA
jgi:hypothetical protein